MPRPQMREVYSYLIDTCFLFHLLLGAVAKLALAGGKWLSPTLSISWVTVTDVSEKSLDSHRHLVQKNVFIKSSL